MNIVLALGLLFALLACIGGENRKTRSAEKNVSPREGDDLAWIDELEFFDAATDIFE